uniref:TSPO associated protein 1 n=1 Tax=Pelusios castaneus TaxID=367368 RepID=A0A8C8RE92_9SAUR
MRDVAERRQQLEVEHEEAQLALQEKQEEVRWLRQAQAEAKRQHEGAVQLLEARVRELEDQCRSHIEQFSLLSQELGRFQLQRGRTDPLTSTLVTSDLPLVPCCSSPPPPRGGWEKDPDVAPARPALQHAKIHEEGSEEREPFPQSPGPGSGVTKTPVSGAAATSPTQVKRPESQSNSSKSESVQNSSKSCPTPEVDTASEMEELDVDNIPLMPAPESQGPAKLQVFLARYSYNPFDGPNETPEAELPLTAGEYIYVYGDMDEDGFFEGELMDGRRGLVPSNFVERVSDDDLMTFLLPEGNDLSQSSYHERSSAGASTGSREKSNHSGEEASVSPSSSRLDEEEPVNHTAVPYPRKPTLLKQLSSSIIIGWEPPLLPAGCTDVQSYNVYVDAELRQNVRSGAQTQAAIEELDVARKAYRVSVQSVTEKGSSDKLRCTLCVGKDVCSAPTLLNVRNLAATSAELTWLPSNSSYAHAVYLNEEERDTAKPGVYWHSLRDLHPGTQYVAKVVARLPDGLWELPQEQKPAVIHFTTPLAGTPEAPLDVQAEPGPSAGILLISWLPVTIDAEGSSNGVRVTGYAVYADGQKVMEVTSPTAGSVLVEVSQLQVFQVCREVSVRTMSLYGESVDSVPAQIPSALRKASRHSSQTQAALSSKPLRGSLPKRAPVTHCAAPLFPPQNYSADNSDAKCMVRTPPQHDSSVHCLPGTVSPHPHLSSPSASSVQALGTSAPGSESARHEPCLAVLPQPAGVGEEPAAASKGPAEEIQAQGTEELSIPEEPTRDGSNPVVPVAPCHARFVAERLIEPSAGGGRKADEQCSRPEPQAERGADSRRDSDASGSCVQELLRVSSAKKLLKETSHGDASGMVPKVKREQEEKVSEAGKRQLNLLAEHSRGSDLSDILEEEEEEEEELCSDMQGERRWDPGVFCSRENGGKLDACDTDSDEDVLERISELPRPKNCSKTLFSIPEVTEEEEEEEEHAVTSESQDGVCQAFPGSDGDDTYRTRLAQAPWTGRTHRESSEDSAQVKPACLELSRAQKTGSRDSRIKPKPGGNSHNRALDPPEGSGRKRRDGAEHCTRLAGGGSHRAHGLPEELREPSSGSETWGRAEPGTIGKTHRDLTPSGLPEAAALTSHCFDARGLEISLEYDSEEEPDGPFPPSPGRRDRVDGWLTACEGWSDRSQAEPTQCDGKTPLKEKAVGWAGSPCQGKEAPRSDGGSEEPGWERESCPAGWRRTLAHPWKGLRRAPRHARVSGNEDLRFQELPGSPAWQTPTRKGRRSRVLKSSSSSSGPARSPAAEALVKDDPARVFVALFDYDPSSMSPNPDAAEEELPFKEGQILKVCGDKDADGFYRGECAGRAGYIPCNMVSEVRVESEEAREELLKQGFMPAAPPVESVGNGTFAPPPRRLTVPPPKPRRAKKAELAGQEPRPPRPGRSWRDLGADPVIPRAMVAVFDYNPRESSPNVDVEAELPFSAGDVITVFGSMDDDGFYYGELNRQRGLVPSNFLEAVSPDGGVTEGLHWREDIAGAVGAGNQVMWLGR